MAICYAILKHYELLDLIFHLIICYLNPHRATYIQILDCSTFFNLISLCLIALNRFKWQVERLLLLEKAVGSLCLEKIQIPLLGPNRFHLADCMAKSYSQVILAIDLFLVEIWNRVILVCFYFSNFNRM